MVRTAGLEPARLTALPPQSSASANSATCAFSVFGGSPRAANGPWGARQPPRGSAGFGNGRRARCRSMVGAVRFELTTSCTRNKRATRLRYAPNQTRRGKWAITGRLAMDFSRFFIRPGNTRPSREPLGLVPGASQPSHRGPWIAPASGDTPRQPTRSGNSRLPGVGSPPSVCPLADPGPRHRGPPTGEAVRR